MRQRMKIMMNWRNVAMFLKNDNSSEAGYRLIIDRITSLEIDCCIVFFLPNNFTL
jgi:hypothetical protein